MNKITAPKGKVIVMVDMEFKNQHTFVTGETIRLERQYNNLNKRETEPVNATVIDGEGIPHGAELLINHNSTHDTNRFFDYEKLSGTAIASGIRHFAIPISDCFFWRMNGGEWNPCGPFATALRVFEPYNGLIEGILPKKVSDTLYVTSGRLKGQVVKTLKACDYEIVFRDTQTGQEGRIIRFRPDGDEQSKREAEAIALLHEHTEKVNAQNLYVGLHPSDAEPIEICAYAD